MLLSACDTSGLDPTTADQVNQSEMTAAVGLPAAAFGGDAYRDAGLQVATASPNDAAQRRSAAEAAPAATGSPIQGATATLDTPAAASAGASRSGTGKCDQQPQCRAASSRLHDYSDRLLAPGRAWRQLGPCLGQDGMVRREQGHRGAGNLPGRGQGGQGGRGRRMRRRHPGRLAGHPPPGRRGKADRESVLCLCPGRVDGQLPRVAGGARRCRKCGQNMALPGSGA